MNLSFTENNQISMRVIITFILLKNSLQMNSKRIVKKMISVDVSDLS